MKVYTLVEEIENKASRIVGVYGCEEGAREALEAEIDAHQYEGEWSRWEPTTKSNVISAENRDVWLIVREWEVDR